MTVYATFQIPAGEIPPGPILAAHPTVTVTVERTVPTGQPVQLLWIAGDDAQQFLDSLRSAQLVTAATLVDELADQRLVRVNWRQWDVPLFSLLDAVDGSLIDLLGNGERWLLEVRFPTQQAVSTFYDSCMDAGIDVELRQITVDRTEDEDDYNISELQREAILAALEAGYFEVPRSTTMSKLANELGISDQAVSERLRRGLGQLLEKTLAKQAASAPAFEQSDESATGP